MYVLADAEDVAAAIGRAEIMARVESAHTLLLILVWLAAFGTAFAFAAMVIFIVKTIRTTRLLDSAKMQFDTSGKLLTHIALLTEKCEDLTARTEAQMNVTSNRTESVVQHAAKTGTLVEETGKEIKDKIEEVKRLVTDPNGPHSGTTFPTVPPSPGGGPGT